MEQCVFNHNFPPTYPICSGLTHQCIAYVHLGITLIPWASLNHPSVKQISVYDTCHHHQRIICRYHQYLDTTFTAGLPFGTGDYILLSDVHVMNIPGPLSVVSDVSSDYSVRCHCQRQLHRHSTGRRHAVKTP